MRLRAHLFEGTNLVPSEEPSSSIWAAITEAHRLEGLETTECVPHSSGDWRPKTRMPAWSVSGEDSFPGSQTALFLLWPHSAVEERASWGPFYKGTNPFLRAPPHDLISPQRPLIHHTGGKISTHAFGRNRNILSALLTPNTQRVRCLMCSLCFSTRSTSLSGPHKYLCLDCCSRKCDYGTIFFF